MSEQVNARMGIYGGFTDGTTNDGLDRFETYQEPAVKAGGFPVARFVIARIQEAELEPRNEVLRVYDQAPAGPMAHRYAKYVRRDMVAFRRIVAQYLDAASKYREAPRQEQSYRTAAATQALAAMYAVANRWSDHPDFQAEWRMS